MTTHINRVPEPTGPVPASCPHRSRFPCYFVTSSHRSGAGHGTTHINIHLVPEPTGPVLATVALTDFLILSQVPTGPVLVM